MNIRFAGLAFAIGAAVLSAGADAQMKSGAENGLLGIKLYDPLTKVIATYGTPDEIDPVNVGGGGASFGGGGGMGGGSPFGPGGPGMGGPPGMGGMPGMGGRRPGGLGMQGMGGGGPAGQADFEAPFQFSDSLLQKGGFGGMMGSGRMPGGPPGVPGMGGMGMGGPPGVPGMGGAGMGGMGMGGPGAGMGGAGAARGGGGAAESTTYTRWVYNRSGSKYAFVIDKYGRVVQIDAIGIQNAKVRTARGIGFGSTFAEIIKKYSVPDGYDIAGDNVTVKFLDKDKVAFRLTRLGDKKPQVVTGIVVAASKG